MATDDMILDKSPKVSLKYSSIYRKKFEHEKAINDGLLVY